MTTTATMESDSALAFALPGLSSPSAATRSAPQATNHNNNDNDNDGDDEVLENFNASGHRPTTTQKEEASNISCLVVALSSCLTTGATTYSFGLYGKTLQETLQLTQGQVDTISTAFFFAGLFSFIPGLCSDRFGARLALVAGGCLGCIHLLLYWAVARQFLIVPRDMIVFTLSILGIMTYLSSALVTGACFKTITIACQGGNSNGTAVGIAKGYVGLGSGLYVAIFEALRKPGETNLDFLPMAACFCIFVVALPGFLFLPTREQVAKTVFRDDTTSLHFNLLYTSLVVVATMVVGSSIKELFTPSGPDHAFELHLEDLMDEPLRPPKKHDGMAAVFIGIWLLPIYSFFILPRKQYESLPLSSVDGDNNDVDDNDNDGITEEDSQILGSSLDGSSAALVRRNSQHDNTNNTNEDEGISLLEVSDDHHAFDDEHDDDDDDEIPSDRRRTRLRPVTPAVRDMNLLQMLRTGPALLMLWTTTILVGAGTLESNNMGHMVQSLGFRDAVTPASIALFSVAQAGARVFTGAISEHAEHWNCITFCVGDKVAGVPRPFFFVLSSFVGFWAHVTLALSTTQNGFVTGAALSGFAFGMLWPLMVLITGEVFGSNNIGANYMFFDGFTSAVGTFLLSKIVAQDVYQAHVLPANHNPDAFSIGTEISSTNGGKTGDEYICLGKGCFQMTQWITAGLSATCIFSSIAMQYMTRDIYKEKLLSSQQHAHSH